MASLRYRMLDVLPVDRSYVVQGMEEGVIVLDPQNRVVDLNPAAERNLGKEISEAAGSKISRLVSSRTGWLTDGYSDAAMIGR